MIVDILQVVLALALIVFLISRARKYPKAAWACYVLILGFVAASIAWCFAVGWRS